MKIIPYESSYFQELVDFLKRNWTPNHAIFDRTLFNWQYKISTQPESLLLLDGNSKVTGFLGNIPSTFLVDGKIKRGSGLTMWVVEKKYQNNGLGILLLKHTQKMNPVTYTLGCNLNVLSMYERMGYSYSPNLNRYVIPLGQSYLKIRQEDISPQTQVMEWMNDVADIIRDSGILSEVTEADELERLFHESISKVFRFAQYRDKDFWLWRYIESKGYKYRILGNPIDAGIVVVRIDRVFEPNRSDIHGLKILRIIEMIPSDSSVWNGRASETFRRLAINVLSWAREQGCVAADFQISNKRLEHVLHTIGFRRQDPFSSSDGWGLSVLFQPLRSYVNPINFVWRIEEGLQAIPVDLEDTYFVKSDCDMDRPNVWPLPEGWNSF